MLRSMTKLSNNSKKKLSILTLFNGIKTPKEKAKLFSKNFTNMKIL